MRTHQYRHIRDSISWWRNQMKHFPRYWPFVRGIHRFPVNSSHKGQWRGAFMFSFICAWIIRWVNTHEAGDLRRYRDHYDVIVMMCLQRLQTSHCGKRHLSLATNIIDERLMTCIGFVRYVIGTTVLFLWGFKEIIFSLDLLRLLTSHDLTCLWNRYFTSCAVVFKFG